MRRPFRFFAAHDADAIQGVGTTADAALTAARANSANSTGLHVVPCTGALYHHVLAGRRDTARWGEVDGIACTVAAGDRVETARENAARVRADGTARSMAPLRDAANAADEALSAAKSELAAAAECAATLREQLAALESQIPTLEANLASTTERSRAAHERYMRGVEAIRLADDRAGGWFRSRRGTVVRLQPDGKHTRPLCEVV